jgi:hypothetical protein
LKNIEIERRDIFDLYFRERGNIALFGSTNSGKTTFCYQVKELVQHAIYFNIIQDIYSENDLSEKIYSILYSSFGLHCKNTDFSSIEAFSNLINAVDRDKYFVEDVLLALSDKEPHAKYKCALQLIDKFAVRFDKNILFIIENFVDFDELYTTTAEADEVFQLTCKIFREYKRVLFIFTGKNEKFCKLFTSSKSSLYKFARVIDMPQITYDAYNKYINQWLTVDDQVSKEIIEAGEYNPQYINEILRELLIHRMISEDSSVLKNHVAIAADKVYQNNIPFLNLRLKAVRGKKYLSAILSLIAQNRSPYEFKETIKSTINRCLSILLDEGLIFAPNNKNRVYNKEHRKKNYEISDPLLKKHILSLFGGQ